MRKYSLTETAQQVRKSLKAMWPSTRFSVTSKRYSGGCSIDVSWIDGPTQKDVNSILDRFERCGFDGMQDMKTYKPHSEYLGEAVEFGADYVQGQRRDSFESIKQAAFRVALECELPLLAVTQNGDGGYISEDSKVSNQRVPYRFFAEENVLAHDSSTNGGEWYSQLIYQVARATSHEAIATMPALPMLANQQHIDAVVKGMVQ